MKSRVANSSCYKHAGECIALNKAPACGQLQSQNLAYFIRRYSSYGSRLKAEPNRNYSPDAQVAVG